MQEPTLRAFFDNTKGLARGTGFLARFLVAWPESTMGTRMFTPPPDGWPALAAFDNRLTAILDRPAPVDDDGILTPAMLTLSPEAEALWIAFHDQIEAMLGRVPLYDLRDVGGGRQTWCAWRRCTTSSPEKSGPLTRNVLNQQSDRDLALAGSQAVSGGAGDAC